MIKYEKFSFAPGAAPFSADKRFGVGEISGGSLLSMFSSVPDVVLFLHVSEGTCHLHCADGTRIAQSGHFVVLWHGANVWVDAQDAFSLTWLWCSSGDFFGGTQNTLHIENPPQSYVQQFFDLAYDINKARNTPFAFLAQTIRLSSMKETARSSMGTIKKNANGAQKPHIHPQLEQLKSLLENSYNENISLESIAEQLGVNKYKLLRDFKAAWGTTPGAYLRKVRLSQAAVLLCGNESVTSIAERTGFNSLSYFTKCFHEAYGVSPVEWKQQHT